MTWDEPLPSDLLTGGTLDALRHRLRSADYTEPSLSALLGLEAPSIRPEVSRRTLIEQLRGLPDGLPILARLFYLGDEVDRFEAADTLGSELVVALERAGILAASRRAADRLRAPVGITPCWGRYILCDPLALDADAEYGPGGPAMGPGADSETLLRTTPRRPFARVLDLCTGPGTHALVAAGHADSVTGVDIAPRALCFARANARLNGVTNARFQLADLTRELPESLGAGFDLVLANPPFVPHPNPQFRYRDGGGPLGDDVLNAILSRLPALVGPGGEARIVSDVAFRPAESLNGKLEAHLGDLAGWDVIGCEDAPFDLADYARFHSLALDDGRMVQDPSAADALLDYYRDVGISRIAPVLIALRRVDGDGCRAFRRVQGVLALRAHHLDAIFASWEGQRRDGPQEHAMSSIPVAAAGASGRQVRLEGGTDVYEIAFAPDAPWSAFRANADLFAVLVECDGQRTGGEINAAFAAGRDKGPEQTRAFVSRVLCTLAELGVLTLTR